MLLTIRSTLFHSLKVKWGKSMDHQFQRIGKSQPRIASSLSSVCRELGGLGKVGQSAAERVQLAGEAFEQFTPTDLLRFLDPEGTEEGASREQMQSARWQVIARNALLIGLILFTWISLSWMISQYQVALATHSVDAGQSAALLPFFVIVESSLVVLTSIAVVLISRRTLQAHLTGQKARACLEEATRLLVPLLFPQSIPAASQRLVAQVDRAIDNAAQQMKGIAADVQQSSDNFKQAVEIFESTTEKQRDFAQVLERSNEHTERIVKEFSDFQRKQAEETRWILESFGKLLHRQNDLLHQLIGELYEAKRNATQQFMRIEQSLDQTSQSIQRIESDTRSALEAIPKRLQEWRFSSSYPQVVQIETQQTLSVYGYMAAALQAILVDLVKSKGRLLSDLRKRASVLVSHQAVISIIPTCEGVRFTPERVSFNMLQNWESADFTFVANKELAQQKRPIEITILAGPIIIASITMEISFVSEQHLHLVAARPSISLSPLPLAASVAPEPELGHTVARRYEHVFASYSHEDISVVLDYKDFCTALGITLDLDRDTLKPGENWNEALQRLIREADIFQLFWSSHSEKSKYVRDEWAYAHSLGKERFIRPVYWENTLPPPPEQLAHLHFVYTPLSQLGQRRRKIPR